MTLFNKLFITFFTKSSDKLISKDGNFELLIPAGFRYKRSKNMYQVFNPLDTSLLLQISGFALDKKGSNIFDSNQELTNELKKIPNAVIHKIGIYNFICSATITADKKLRTYTWKTGDKNKRVLITVLFQNIQQIEVGEKLKIVQPILNSLIIKPAL